MKKKLIAPVVAAGLVVTAGGAFAAVRLLPDGAVGHDPVNVVQPARNVTDARLPEVERLVDVFETRVARNDDPLDLRTLGTHYLDRASITHDVRDYRHAIDVLEKARRTNPGLAEIELPLAQARLALHEFDSARALAEPYAVADDGTAIAVVGDAALEVGDVAAASDAYERLAALAPDDPAVAVRVSNLNGTRGDFAGSIEEAERALWLASDQPPQDRSFYTTYLGLLHLEGGEYEPARKHLEAALELDPVNASAMIELAHVEFVDRRYDEAIRLLETALRISPEPEVPSLLGDLYTLKGDDERAEAYYGQVEHIASAAPGAYRRDVSTFLSDHDRELEKALRLAQEDLGARRDPGAYDTLAWALFRSGRLEEARDASDRALELGGGDAGSWYHAGQISLALGNRERGLDEIRQALEANRHFSLLLAVQAADLLER